MKNNSINLSKITCLAALAAALSAAPATSWAADTTNAPAAQTVAPKPHGMPFHGKVSAVDATAMTITLKTQTITVASTTKIIKDGKPAVFADITVGAMVSGSYKKDAAGKLTASKLTIGAAKSATTPAPQ